MPQIKTSYLFCLSFLLLSFISKAQIALNGIISDTANVPVTGCVLKIKKKNKIEFLYFEILHQKSHFNIILPKVKKGDTLEIQIEHSSYTPVTEILVVSETVQKNELKVKLYPFVKQLKEIVIKPAFWKRGDTTIYTVDSFATGEERKLKDIITKLPGFTIDHEGNLKFKNKKVERIYIEGEDLFADRTALLLESFPVHVLSQVEAIENDPKNKLLKGLSLENQTVVNLKLKDKKNVVFGDVELTGTTNKRYAVNPTVFSVTKKVKFATAGYYNNMGTNFEKVYPLLQLSSVTNPPSLQIGNIYTINNFNASRYILNRLMNQQFVSNYKLLKKVNSKTEFSYGNEHINQTYSSQNIFIDTSSTLNRFDSTFNNNFKRRTGVKHEMEWLNGSKERLVAGFTWEKTLKGNTSFNNIKQEILSDTIISNGNANRVFLKIDLQYTRRIDSLKAIVVKYKYHQHKIEQIGTSFNDKISAIFGIGNSDFNLALIDGLTNIKEQELRFEWLRKNSKYIFSHNLILTRNTMGLNTNLNAGQKSNPAFGTINFQGFSNAGTFQHNNAEYLLRYNKKQNQNILNIELYGGGSYLVRKELNRFIDRKLLPTARFIVSYTLLPKKNIALPFVIEFINKPVSIENLLRNPMIIQYTSFQQLAYPLRTIPTIKASAGFSKLNLNGIFSYFQFSFTSTLISEVTTNRFNLFFNFEERRLTSRVTNQYGFSTNHNIPVSSLKAVFEVNLNSYLNEQLLQSGNQLIKNTNLWSSAIMLLRFRNFKKFSFVIETGASYSQNFIPSSSGFNDLERKILNLTPKFNGRWYMAKNFSTGVQSAWYRFDLLNNPIRLLFADADLIWKPKDSKFSLEMKAENLFNEQVFTLTNVFFNAQSLTNIPLIGRNIQVSARVNF